MRVCSERATFTCALCICYRECESNELKGSASSSLMKAIIQCKSQSSTTALDSISSSGNLLTDQLSPRFNSSSQYQTQSGSIRQGYQSVSSGLLQQSSSGTMMSGETNQLCLSCVGPSIIRSEPLLIQVIIFWHPMQIFRSVEYIIMLIHFLGMIPNNI